MQQVLLGESFQHCTTCFRFASAETLSAAFGAENGAFGDTKSTFLTAQKTAPF